MEAAQGCLAGEYLGCTVQADAVEKDGAMPDVPRLLIRGMRSASDRWRSASVSLDGLLDYDEEVGPSGCANCMQFWAVVRHAKLTCFMALRPSADIMCRIAMSTPWS